MGTEAQELLNAQNSCSHLEGVWLGCSMAGTE
jgi:hypothetical protein